MEKWFEMAPNGARRILFLLIQTLPTFWAEQICILRCFMFVGFLNPKFLDFQVSGFPNSQTEAWARPGPDLGRPAYRETRP